MAFKKIKLNSNYLANHVTYDLERTHSRGSKGTLTFESINIMPGNQHVVTPTILTNSIVGDFISFIREALNCRGFEHNWVRQPLGNRQYPSQTMELCEPLLVMLQKSH